MTDTTAALLKALEAGDYSAFPMLLDHLEETGETMAANYLRDHLYMLYHTINTMLSKARLVEVNFGPRGNYPQSNIALPYHRPWRSDRE